MSFEITKRYPLEGKKKGKRREKEQQKKKESGEFPGSGSTDGEWIPGLGDFGKVKKEIKISMWMRRDAMLKGERKRVRREEEERKKRVRRARRERKSVE